MIESLFETLGLNVNERAILLALSQAERLSAAEIARHCQLTRNTVYLFLESLEHHGLITSSSPENWRTVYSIAAPKAFVEFVKTEKHSLEQRELAAESLFRLLSAKQ